MGNFWKGKKVLVTGGAGFVGSFVTEQLLRKGAIVTIVVRGSNTQNVLGIKKDIKIVKADLSLPDEALKASKRSQVVLHLAAKVAGIDYNINHPATMFSENIILTRNVLEAAVKNGVERVLLTSSACVYPRHATIPTKESEGFVDDPEPTNLGYGWAKRVVELMGRFYNQEYGLKVGIGRPYNTYGPRDNFDPATSHVIPAMIKRLYDGEDPFVVWGSGKQTRSFIFVEDVARGLIEIAEKYPNCDPLNLGSEEEVTIGELAKLLISASGKKVHVKFDKTKPDGQPRRNCDTSHAKSKIGFTAKTPLEEGLKKTLKWYEQHLLS